MIRLIVVSLLLSFLLMAIPMGYDWRWCRPEFVVLLVIYWSMYSPQHFGLMSAWLVGIGLDLLKLSPLGLHALGTLLVAYVVHLTYQRIRNYVLWHQGVWVFILVGIFQLFIYWLNNLYGYSGRTPFFLLSAFLTGLLWPLLVVFMARIRVQWRLD